jgi:hypothetical protein
MICDLSGNTPFPSVWIYWINEISEEIRGPIVDFVGELSRGFGNGASWWCSPLASRNPYSISLINDLHILCLALRISAAHEDLTEMVVPSMPLAAVLGREFARRGRQVRVRSNSGVFCPLKSWLRLLGRVASGIYHGVARYVFGRLTRLGDMPRPAIPLVLVDTFLYADSASKGFHDRHYPGLLDCLDVEEKREVFFVPTYYKVKNYLTLFQDMKRSGVNFLPKEAFLTFGDFIWALLGALKMPKPGCGAGCVFLGVGVQEMVSAAVTDSRASSGMIEGLLAHRFFRRLKERGVEVRLIVDWFENQEVDKGFNGAARRYFPDADVIGYQGFLVARTYLCRFPTDYELSAAVLPKRVAVVGRGLVRQVKEFCQELEVVVAPALRFSGVWLPLPDRSAQSPFTVLVALPIIGKDARELLDAVAGTIRIHRSVDSRPIWKVLVKAHPAMPGACLDEAAEMGFEVVSGSFQTILGNADVLVSNTSSVCFESVARGVPVVVHGSRYGITHNPIPSAVPTRMWSLCLTAEEIHRALVQFSDRSAAAVAERHEIGEMVRKEYFEPVTPHAVRRMLGFRTAN